MLQRHTAEKKKDFILDQIDGVRTIDKTVDTLINDVNSFEQYDRNSMHTENIGNFSLFFPTSTNDEPTQYRVNDKILLLFIFRKLS